jgi:hypothetical protein
VCIQATERERERERDRQNKLKYRLYRRKLTVHEAERNLNRIRNSNVAAPLGMAAQIVNQNCTPHSLCGGMRHGTLKRSEILFSSSSKHSEPFAIKNESL